MTLRIYTNETFLDIELKDIYEEQQIITMLQQGNEGLCLTTSNDTTIVVNIINIVAIEIIPPIKK